MKNDQKKMGRPCTVVNEAQAAALWAEYQRSPFNISARARKMGVLPSTLAYHIRGGKGARCSASHWRTATRAALEAFRKGDRAKAAAWFREAAKRIEGATT